MNLELLFFKDIIFFERSLAFETSNSNPLTLFFIISLGPYSQSELIDGTLVDTASNSVFGYPSNFEDKT